MPTRITRLKQNYRVDVDVRNSTGAAVFEAASGRAPPELAGLPRGVYATAGVFRIGDRTFTRAQSFADAGARHSLRETFARRGSKYEEDVCRDKQPGPPLGMEPVNFSAIDNELPATRIKLLRSARNIGSKR